MRTKENDFLSKYYTNNTIKVKIDKILQELNEEIMPYKEAVDCSDKEYVKLSKKVRTLEGKIKELDLEYWKLNIHKVKI